MGIEYSGIAIAAWVIKLEELRKIVPAEVAAIEDERERQDISWELVYDEWQCEAEPFYSLIDNLINAFKARTGLWLSLELYLKDRSDINEHLDHTEGCVFTVEGMTQLTEAGQRLADVVKEQLWVEYI